MHCAYKKAMQTQAVAASELKRLGRHNATLQVVESLVKEPHCFSEFARSLLNKRAKFASGVFSSSKDPL